MESVVGYEKACRLCLCTTGDTRPIFPSEEEPPQEGPHAQLAHLIEESLDIQIDESDGLTTQICTKCTKNVNNWQTFKRVCNYSQEKLREWVNRDPSENIDVKAEHLHEGHNEADVVIDASYPEVQMLEKEGESKIQSEGPPILASLGLAPRNEKENGEEGEEGEEEAEAPKPEDVVRKRVKKSIMRPHRPLPLSHMTSKSCLVCDREYRYSHNARRHELVTHNYDRYSNKILSAKGFNKLRPNPLNLKARMFQSPINQRVITVPSKLPNSYKFMPKVKSEPYPVQLRSLVDLQQNRQPQILKSLLTRKPEKLVSEPEIMRSGSQSPETLITEPELAAYHVETIISEPDTYMNSIDQSEGEGDGGDEQMYEGSGAEVDSEEEGDKTIVPDENKVNGVNGEDQLRMKVRKGSVEHITPDDHDMDDQSADEGVDPEDTFEEDEEKQEVDEYIPGEEEGAVPGEETYNEIDVDEHDVQGDHGDEEQFFEGDEDDDDMPPPPIAPIVEINEGQQPQADETNEENEAEEEGEDLLEKVGEQQAGDPPSLTMTPVQKSFILKYRDVIEQINTLKCKCCNKAHPRRKAVIQHLQKTGQKVPKHTCYNCVITFGHIGALLSHMRANVCTDLWKVIFEEGGIPDDMVVEGHDPAKQSKVAEKSGRDEVQPTKSQYKDVLNARSYACKLCSAKYQLKQMIMKHIFDMHENGGQRIPLCCIHCKYRFKDNKVWKRHIRNGECTVYIACDMCPQKFRSLIHFNDHALTVHVGGDSSENLSRSVDGRPTDCRHCGKTHSSYHSLVKHLKTVHNEEQPHMCQHCDSKFAQVSDLNQHIYFEHSERTNGDQSSAQGNVDLSIVKQEETAYNYSCTDCEAIFDSVDGWTQHQIDVHNHTAYECDLCEKKYLDEAELLQHKNDHLKVRFYSCTLCSNSYNSAQSLSEHMMVSHPGEPDGGPNDNPFFCEMCQRSFKNRQAFSNHMRIHSNIPTHNKKAGSVAEMSALKRVQPQFTFAPLQRNSPKSMAGAPYSCDICGKGFLHKKNIWKHKKVLHPEEARRIELEKTGTHFLNHSLDLHSSQNSDSTGLSIPQFDSFTTAMYEEPAQEEYQSTSSVPVPRQSSQVPNQQVYQCDLCDKKFSVRSSIWKHKRVKHGIVNPQMQEKGGDSESKISCTVCKINFSDKKSYQRHKKAVHNVSCKICDIELSSTMQLYEHYKAAHAKELLGYNDGQASGMEESREGSDEGEDHYVEGEEENPEDKYQARYPCGDCGRTFVGMTALQEHNCQDESGDSQVFECEICNKTYSSISALKSHRGWHLRSQDGKAAISNSGLWMPQRQSNKISKFEVKDSPSIKHSTPELDHLEIKRKLPPDVQMTLLKKKKLNDEVTLELVQSVPRFDMAETSQKIPGEDTRTCDPCGKQFCSKAGFMRHMEEVHKPSSIFCPLCSKSFTRKSTLLVHMRKHGVATDGTASGAESGGESTPVVQKEPERLYACDMCNVRYTTSKSLRRHRLKHHSDLLGVPVQRPSPSSIVGTRVVEVGGPSRHKCTQCGETFPTEKELWQHPHYGCEQCPMVFSRQQYLSAHIRSRHQDVVPGQFFPCSMCDRFYMNKKSLQRHIETSH